MKKRLLNVNTVIFLLVLAAVLYMRLPMVIRHFGYEGKVIPYQLRTVISQSAIQEVEFPSKNSNSIAIFWATWCAPCKLEMARLKNSVEEGKIPRDKIFAINPFEESPVVKKFLSENPYPFIFIEGRDISRELQIEVTPTVLFLEGEKITSMSSGLSIIGIWRAEALF